MIHPLPTFRALLVPVCRVMAIVGTLGLQAAEPIVVIASFNMTGPEAVLDAPCYRGAELAVEKLNAAGGVLGRPIQLIGSTRQATLAAPPAKLPAPSRVIQPP